MPLVDDGDVQVHLPADTLAVEGIPDDRNLIYLDAERVVRAVLTGAVESTVMATWTTPATTPDIIRAACGRLAAAEIYRLRFGQQAFTDPEYAQVKYNEAMMLLQKLIAGEIVIPGVDSGVDFDNTWFEPTDASTDQPKFTMSGRY